MEPFCARTAEYRKELLEQRLTREMLSHCAECDACNEAMFLASLEKQKQIVMNSALMAPPDSIWWLAALEEQRRLVRRPEAAVNRMAIGICLVGAMGTAALAWETGSVLFRAAMTLAALVLSAWTVWAGRERLAAFGGEL